MKTLVVIIVLVLIVLGYFYFTKDKVSTGSEPNEAEAGVPNPPALPAE